VDFYLNGKTALITQRSRVQIPPRYQEVQVRGLIARGGQAFLIFVAAWWQQDQLLALVAQDSAGLVIAPPVQRWAGGRGCFILGWW